MKSSVEHAIRLGFSNSARPDQEPVQWTSTPEITPGSLAYEYYVTLCDIKKNSTTLEIITWLAKQGEVQTLTQSEHFLKTLSELNRPYIILSRVKNERGHAYAHEVRELFNNGEAEYLKRDEQNILLAWLLKQPVAENLAVVEKYWHEDLTSDLCRVISLQITQPEPIEDVLSNLCELARRVGKLADVLKTALNQVTAAAPRQEAGQHSYSIVIRLVHRDFPLLVNDLHIAQLLWKDSHLRYEFALQSAQYRQDARARLDWLENQRSMAQSPLRVFHIALNLLDADAHLDMLEPLKQANVGYVRRLFKVTLGSGTRGVDRLAPVMVDWLLQQVTTLAQTERESWVTLLRSIPIQSVQQPDLQARIDLLILAFESDSAIPPQFLEGRLSDTPQQFYAYSQALDAALRTLPPQPQDKVIVGLVDILRRLSRYKPENMLTLGNTLGNTLWPSTRNIQTFRNVQTATSLCKHMFDLFKKHTQLRQDEENIREWGQRLSEVGMQEESFELYIRRFDHAPLPEIVEYCADRLVAPSANPDQILAGMKKLLRTRSLDFIEFMALLLEDLRNRKMRGSDVATIECRLLENSPQADAYLRRLTPLFFADLERLNRLIPLMKAHLDKDEMIKLHELLETAAKHSQPPGWFPFWKR
jgi:hypothetical protein